MYTLTAAQAQAAALQHANSNTLSVQQIEQLLGNVSVTFAQIMYVTLVQLAAKHRDAGVVIQKVTNANVILSSTLAAHTSIYANKVKKTARGIPDNDQAAVESFTPAQNYYEHTECFSIVRHREHHDKFYLYALFNPGAKSLYLHNGNIVDEQYIAQFMTPSGIKALTDKGPVVNKTHNIKHAATVRSIALSNIVSIHARKQLATV